MAHFTIIAPPFTSHVRALEALAYGLLDKGHRISWVHQGDVQPLLGDRRIARACRALDAQLLLAHCNCLDAIQVEALRRAGATWVTGFAPQRAALARAEIVISHAGLNTALDAPAAGKPVLALPSAFAPPGVAARLVHAGAGLRLLPAKASAARIEQNLRRLLDEPGFAQRARLLGAEVAVSSGVSKAVEIIEAALRPPPFAYETEAMHVAHTAAAAQAA